MSNLNILADQIFVELQSKPGLLALIVKKARAPKVATAKILGDTPKQKAAWKRLSGERQEYLLACEEWRKAWKAWHYNGAAYPGPEPVDTISVEAMSIAKRIEALDHARQVAEDGLMARWGGDMAARDAAILEAPKRGAFSNDADHHAAVVEFMNEASKAARENAEKQAQPDFLMAA